MTCSWEDRCEFCRHLREDFDGWLVNLEGDVELQKDDNRLQKTKENWTKGPVEWADLTENGLGAAELR